MKYLRLILRNLTRNRRRTILTMLSIAVLMAIFVVVATLPTIANHYIHASASSLRIVCHNRAGLFFKLPESYRRPILASQYVSAASGFEFFPGIYRDPRDPIPAYGVDADQFEGIWADWGVTPEAAEHFRSLRTAVIVAPAVMRRFGWHVGQRFTLRGTADPVSLNMEVIGSLKDTAPPDAMLFRRDYLEESLNGPGMVNTFWLSAKGPQSVPLALEEIKQRFANSGAEMECEEEAVFVSNMARGARSVIRMLQSIGYIVVVVVALIAGNTAAMSIRERAEELGVMRAMGFEKKTLFAILIGECLAIAIIGGLAGAAISQAILRALPLINASFGPFGYVTIPGSVLILCLFFSVAIGVVSGIFPAAAQLRNDVMSSLRRIA